MKRPDQHGNERPESPIISIVIGSNNARQSIAGCVSTIIKQIGDRNVELVIVDNSDDGTKSELERMLPGFVLIHAPQQSRIPELWSDGIQYSTGDIVAVTTAHCIPKDNWLNEIIAAHKQPHAAIGGAFTLSADASLTDSAIFFTRYSRYSGSFQGAPDIDIAGDNASYKRRVLIAYERLYKDGFWEPIIHTAMVSGGHSIWLSPDIIVEYQHSFGFAGFVRNRIDHGREHGIAQVDHATLGKRLMLSAKAPLVPVVLTFRAARVIFERKRYRRRFLYSSMHILLFYIAWSAGELTGYWRGSDAQ